MPSLAVTRQGLCTPVYKTSASEARVSWQLTQWAEPGVGDVLPYLIEGAERATTALQALG